MTFLVANNISGEIYYVNTEANTEFLDIDVNDSVHFYGNTVFNDIVTHWWDQENYTTVPKQEFALTYSHPHTTYGPFEEINVGPGTISRTLDENVYRPMFDEEANTVVEVAIPLNDVDDAITFFHPFDKIEVNGTQDITISGIPTEPYTAVFLDESTLDIESGTITFSSSNNHIITIVSPKYITKTIEIIKV